MQDAGLSEAGEESSSGRPRGETKSMEDEAKRSQKTLVFIFLEQHDSDGGRTLEENYECVGWQTAVVAVVLERGGDEC